MTNVRELMEMLSTLPPEQEVVTYSPLHLRYAPVDSVRISDKVHIVPVLPPFFLSSEWRQFLYDIFVTAIEGGINHWARIEAVHHPTEGEPFNAAITVEGEFHTITPDTIAHGLLLSGRFQRHIVLRDSGDIDALDADYIIQHGLFEELVYG